MLREKRLFEVGKSCCRRSYGVSEGMIAIDMYKREYIPLDPPAKTQSGLQRGDRVIVARLPSVQELNHWKDAWLPHMDRSVGSIGTVSYVSGPTSVCIEFDDLTKLNGFNYPDACVTKMGTSMVEQFKR